MARTLEQILGRCIIKDGDDGKEHWIWTGATNPDGQCIVRAPDWGRDPTGKQTWNMGVHRAIYMVTKKKPVPNGKHFFQTCSEPGCVNPACTAMVTRKRGGVHVSRRVLANQELRARLSASSLRTWDKRGRGVPEETVVAIIQDPEKSLKKLSEKYNVDHTTIWKYRTGQLRKSAGRRAMGMFSQLLAA